MTRRVRRLALAIACVIGGGAAFVASDVAAHAGLIGASPASGSVLDTSPDEIALTFSESVDALDDSIRLLDADGAPIDTGPVVRTSDTAVTAAVADALPRGSYVVAWEVVSADSHTIRGAFVFSVGEPSDTPADALLDDVLADQPGEGRASLGLGVGRLLSYGGVMALLGTAAALMLLAPDLLARLRVVRLLQLFGAMSIVGTVLMVCAQASAIGDSIFDWQSVGSTRSGRWWLVRLGAVTLITIATPAARRMCRSASWRTLASVVALAMVGVVAAGGHAVSGRFVVPGAAATVIHVASAALWIGLIVTMVAVIDRSHVVTTAAAASPFALLAVCVLAVSGLFNSWRQVGAPMAVFDSSYGRWLLVKLLLVVIVLCAAVVGRAAVRASSSAAAARDPVGIQSDGHVFRMQQIVAFEAIGMVLILGATAGLAGSVPPRALPAADARITMTEAGYTAQVDLVPAVTGGTTMHVTITAVPTSSAPIEQITVEAALPLAELGPIEIPTLAAGANHVTTSQANFPIAGLWSVTVTARIGEFDQVVFTSDVAITDP